MVKQNAQNLVEKGNFHLLSSFSFAQVASNFRFSLAKILSLYLGHFLSYKALIYIKMFRRPSLDWLCSLIKVLCLPSPLILSSKSWPSWPALEASFENAIFSKRLRQKFSEKLKPTQVFIVWVPEMIQSSSLDQKIQLGELWLVQSLV